MHSSLAIVSCVGMLLDIRNCMPASLPPCLLGIILNAKRNSKSKNDGLIM